MAEFKYRWFERRARATWEKHLPAALADAKRLRYLEIGTWEAASSYWVCQNLLPKFQPGQSPGGHFVLCVDPYLPDRKHDKEEVEAIYQRALANLAPWRNRGCASIFRHTSAAFWRSTAGSERAAWDLIYIDGCHTADQVVEDSIMAWWGLKDQGILIWDDIRRAGGRDHEGVMTAVRAFESCFKGQFDPFFETRHQLAIRKRGKT